MANLLELILTYPGVNAFRRIKRLGDDPMQWEYEAQAGDVLANADRDGFYVIGALNIRSQEDVRRCFMDLSLPERMSDDTYVLDGGELYRTSRRKLGGEVIPAIAIDGFGVYELFYSKISPEVGINVLRRGLEASRRKRFIAEDLGYILRDEGRDREAAEERGGVFVLCLWRALAALPKTRNGRKI